MPRDPIEFELTYNGTITTAHTVEAVGIELVIGAIYPTGGGGGGSPVAVSAVPDNTIEMQPDGLWAAPQLASAQW